MAKPTLTLAEIAKMDCMFLIPSQVAPVLGCAQYYINVASQTPDGRLYLGFPVVRIGNRVKIPRIPFLRYMGWEGAIKGAKEE